MSARSPYPTERSRDPRPRETLLVALFALLAALYAVPVVAAIDAALWFTPLWPRLAAALRALVLGAGASALAVAVVWFVLRYRPRVMREHRDAFRRLVCAKGMRSLNVALLGVGGALAVGYCLFAGFAVVPTTLLVFAGAASVLCLAQVALPLPARPRDLAGGDAAPAVDASELEDRRLRWRFTMPSAGRGRASEPREAVVRVNLARCRELAARSGPPCLVDDLRERVTSGVTAEIHQLARQLDDWERAQGCCAYDTAWHIASLAGQFRCESASCAVPEGREVACPYPVEVIAAGASPSPVGVLVLAAALARALTHRSALLTWTDGGASHLALGIEASEGAQGGLVRGPDCRYYLCRIVGSTDAGQPVWSIGEVPRGMRVVALDHIEGLVARRSG